MFNSRTQTLQVLGLSLLVVLFVVSESHAATCESLQALSLPNTTITLTQSVAAGAFSSPDPGRGGAPPTAAFKQLPAFCRVAATLRPSTDSDIKIEVWMPLANWNGKFQGVGNGGLAGFIMFTAGRGGIERGMAEALRRGYATASTDTGHTGDTAAPFLGHPEKLVDFAYRAVHEMTVTAKAIVHAFYDTNPKLSYWNGCSTGGRQGLVEAQRFPDDYDGIIAGAPAISQTRLVTWSTHVGHAALKEPQNVIPSSKYPMIHRVRHECMRCGRWTKDGVIDDPRRCRFDFKTIECKGGDSASCLTTAQVEIGADDHQSSASSADRRDGFSWPRSGDRTRMGPQDRRDRRRSYSGRSTSSISSTGIRIGTGGRSIWGLPSRSPTAPTTAC